MSNCVTPATKSPLWVALTVDVDPDANRPVAGRMDAVSAGPEGRVGLTACRRGLDGLADILEELALPCTVFWEARSLRVLGRTAPALVERYAASGRVEHACHGLRHEEFAGLETGVPVYAQTAESILHEAALVVAGEVGKEPAGFRAPYCRLSPSLRTVLARLGFRYDATLSRMPGPHWALRPYLLQGSRGKVWELALALGRDRRDRPIGGYLWQLFEGRRSPGDYIDLIASMAARYCGGLLQLALHPWHMVVDSAGRSLPPSRDAAGLLREILLAAKSHSGACFVPAGAYLRQMLTASAAS